MRPDRVIRKLNKIIDDLRLPNSQYAQAHGITGDDTKQYKIDQTIDRLENLIEVLTDEMEEPKGLQVG